MTFSERMMDAESARRSRVISFMWLCGSPNKCPSLQKRREGFSLSSGRITGSRFTSPSVPFPYLFLVYFMLLYKSENLQI